MVLTAILLPVPAIRKVVRGRKERGNAEEDDEKWKKTRWAFGGRRGRWEEKEHSMHAVRGRESGEDIEVGCTSRGERGRSVYSEEKVLMMKY
jgi:hypothetical protein